MVRASRSGLLPKLRPAALAASFALALSVGYCFPNGSAATETCPYCPEPKVRFQAAKGDMTEALRKQTEALEALEKYKREKEVAYGNDYNTLVTNVRTTQADAKAKTKTYREADSAYRGALVQWAGETSERDKKARQDYIDAQINAAHVNLNATKDRIDLNSARIRQDRIENLATHYNPLFPQTVEQGLPARHTLDVKSLKNDVPSLAETASELDENNNPTTKAAEDQNILDSYAEAAMNEGTAARESLMDNHKIIMPDSELSPNETQTLINMELKYSSVGNDPPPTRLEVEDLQKRIRRQETQVKNVKNDVTKTRNKARTSFSTASQAHNNSETAKSDAEDEDKNIDTRIGWGDQVLEMAQQDNERADEANWNLGIPTGESTSGAGDGGEGEMKDPTAAKNYLDKVLEGDPDNPDAHSARALANSKLGNNAAACADARAALRGNPNDRRAFGITKLHCPRSAIANSRFDSTGLNDRLGTKDPSQNLLAMNYSARSPSAMVPGAAVGRSRRVADPEKAHQSRFLQGKARQYLRAGDYRRAIDVATKALQMDPGSAGAWFMRASAYSAMGDYQKALADARRGLALKPGSVELMNTMAYAQNKLGDYEGAAESARAAIKADPTNAAAYANLAYALGKMGNRKGMLEALRKASGLNPDYNNSLREAMESPPDADFPFLFPGEKSPKGASKSNSIGVGRKLLLTVSMLLIIGVPLVVLMLRSKGGSESEESETSAEGDGEAHTADGENPESNPPEPEKTDPDPPAA